jgi:hypothetical protein
MPTLSKPPKADLYSEVEALLQAHSKTFTAGTGMVKNKRDYHLIVVHDVEAGGRRHGGLFASVIEQKGYVGFYFTPIYSNPALKKQLSPTLLKLLKGKTCFHVKRLTPELQDAIKAALQAGIEQYRKQGWL